MAEDLIRYDVLVQEATRGVIRKVLTEVARAGLPGEHHFYIAFDTSAPGVRISSRLKERYPDEVTIVLQHQFWDLTVTDTCFEVSLAFGGVPEKLLVPFAAIKAFFDPSVETGFQFDVEDAQKAGGAAETGDMPLKDAPVPAVSGPVSIPVAEPVIKPEIRPEAEPAAPSSASVVSLDQFRKKT